MIALPEYLHLARPRLFHLVFRLKLEGKRPGDKVRLLCCPAERDRVIWTKQIRAVELSRIDVELTRDPGPEELSSVVDIFVKKQIPTFKCRH